jgi:hypothetical protein
MRKSILCLFLFGVGTAHAQTSLGISRIEQETGSWCFAAVTQMVAKFLGSSIRQCEISNIDNNRTDCCDPTPPSACVNGGSTHKMLDYWGFPHTYVTSFVPFSTIKREIDQHSPLVTGWDRTGGGRHAVLVDGYWVKSDGSQFVEVVNPSQTGDTEWASYQVYLTGGVVADGSTTWTEHTVSSTDYDLKWGPICSYDFFGLAIGDYQRCFDQRVHHGNWPSAIASGAGTMSGAFHGSASAPVSSNLSRTDLKTRVDSLSGSGWRPLEITVSATSLLFDAIWTSSGGLPWKTNYALSSTELHDTNATLNSQGYRMVDLFAYNDDIARFTATWVKQSGGYRADRTMTVDQFKSQDTTNRLDGYLLTRVSTYYDDNGQYRVAALWLPSGSGYHWVLGTDGAGFQNEYDTYTGFGYSLSYVSQQGSSYNLIFTK